MSKQRRKCHLNSPLWPKFKINGDNVDGNLPSSRVKSWSHLVEIINEDELFNHTDEVLFRGQRHSHWGLTPSIARLSKTGVYEEEWASKHLDGFKYSIRGRTKIPVAQMNNDEDIWSLGQHYGLWTPLLDWSHSPFVAMFFAFNEPNPKDENPKNYSRALFFINRSKLVNILPDQIFVNPLSSDHDRLISQDGLFTMSPSGETSLELEILNSLAENGVDIDDADVLKDYIFKIHIPMEEETNRLQCVKALRRMNLHFANLYPDVTGSSLHCNDLLVEQIKRMQVYRSHALRGNVAPDAPASR